MNKRCEIDFALEEIQTQYSRSSGPGGQHVNTTESRVTVSWNFSATSKLNLQQKDRLIMLAGSRIKSDGWLQISCGTFRSRKRNQDECFKRLKNLVSSAIKVPEKRRTTRIPRSQKEQRLKSKRKHSETKSLRKKPDW